MESLPAWLPWKPTLNVSTRACGACKHIQRDRVGMETGTRSNFRCALTERRVKATADAPEWCPKGGPEVRA